MTYNDLHVEKFGGSLMKRIGICVLCLLIFSSGSAWADIVIIAHQDVSETTVTEKDLQEIFLGKRVQWKDNTAIHPVTVKEAEFHKAFLKQYVNKSIAKWNAHWKRMVFTGNGTPPKQVATQQELLEYVVNTAGAIGYIDAETPVESVTIIEVQ
jgi:ABC-type phosphate transport system substrate-binding protein